MTDRLPAGPGGRGRRILWASLWLIALTVRLWGVWYFPTAEQDGYSDAETIARFSAEMAQGGFQFSHLYGFWLPLFQFVAAVPNIWMHNPLVAGEGLSALCGAAACVLAFAISLRLTQSLPLSGAVFVIVSLSPIHLLYSSACMTDVPFDCLLLASLWFTLRDQWTAGMICAAIAGGVRVEAWALIPLLPLLQFIKQKRVSPAGVIALLAPPLLWLVVSHLARGDWFAFFHDRVRYHERYMDFHPSRRGFTLTDIRGDLDMLMFGANRIVFLAAPAAAIVLAFRFVRRASDSWEPFVALSYFATLFAFLILGYVTKRQPVWLPRYGLFALVLGAPLLAWLWRLLLAGSRPRWLGQIGVTLLILLCATEARSQFSIIPKVLADFRAHSDVAKTLQLAVREENDPGVRCFSDDVSVRVLSGLPPAKFVQSHDAPPSSWDDGGVFDAFLRREKVRYLVFMATEDSLPAKWCPGPERVSLIGSARFEPMVSARSEFGPDVALYRLKD